MSKGTRTFRYLTFDCYGTLIDWKRGIGESLESAFGGAPIRGNALLDAYVAAEKEEEKVYRKYRDVLRLSALRLADSLGTPLNKSAAAKFAASLPKWPVFPDTARFLHDAGENGYKRFILSNVDTGLLEQTIKRNGLEVDGYVTAEEVGSYKPKAGHWIRFLEKTGAPRRQVLHVAQSIYHDILPTQKLGIASAWVNRYREPAQIRAAPLIIVDSLAHLAPMLWESKT